MAMIVVGVIDMAAAYGQTGVYYLTSDASNAVFAIQDGAVIQGISQAGQGTGQFPIAVAGTIRTTGNGPGLSGGEYTLGGVPTGATYPNSAPSGQFFDGATNGSFNYSVDFVTGNVYQFNSDWSGAKVLFTAAVSDIGITYDFANQSLWLQNYYTGMVTDYTLDGTMIGGFSTGMEHVTALALDYNDGTFWFNAQDGAGGFGALYNFDAQGNSLGFDDSIETEGQGFEGGEFAVPEPSLWACCCVGGVGLCFVALRRRGSRGYA